MVILEDLLRAADRFDKWAQVQAEVASVEGEAAMQEKRLNFASGRYLPLDSDVFLEEIVEGSDLMPIRYFELGQIASRSTGRIHIDLGPRVGEGYATGFLVAPGVLLTNWHVFKKPEVALAATVSFNAQDDIRGLPEPAKAFQFQPNNLYVADETLDFALVGVKPVAVDGMTLLNSYGYLKLFAQTGKITRNEYATIVQHPRGRQKQVAVRNNRIVVYAYNNETTAPDNDYIYYETDTLPGSSGSPVFSDEFFLVALHRQGVPKTALVDGKAVPLRKDGTPARPTDVVSDIDYIANEEVRVSSMMQCLERLASCDPKVEAARDAVLAAAGVVADGPFSTKAAPMSIVPDMVSEDASDLEIVRRKTDIFKGAPGYQSKWLTGFDVPLPAPSQALAKELAPRTDGVASPLLHFDHFSACVHAPRRMPVFAAVNIDGRAKALVGAMPRRPPWSYDPRISDEHQMDDTLFSSLLQRGHMAARDFVYWGADEATADIHSFTLSNVCPQIGAFNGNKEWSKLEKNIIKLATTSKKRLSVFMGPILDKEDPLYDDLRSPQSTADVGTGIRLPLRFWYIVMWVDNGLQVRPYILDQSDDIQAAGPLEIDLEKPDMVIKTTIGNIEKLTRLKFEGLA